MNHALVFPIVFCIRVPSDFISGYQAKVPTNMSTDWFTTSPVWSAKGDDHKSILLSTRNNLNPIPDVTLPDIIEKSTNFPIEFPTESVRCRQLLKNKIPEVVLEKNINSTYPVIHEHALYLCSIFLNHQVKHGNRTFYQNMSLLDFIDRLLSKRAVSFVGVRDLYMLLDGSKGVGNWESIGSGNEAPPLVLEKYLSYDEIRLSALLSVSSHTCFVNDGNRRNEGVFEEDRKKVEEDGVIIGLIGTRLPKPKVMEYREIMKTKEQNNHENGYGRFFLPTLQGKFLNFYGDESATYDALLKKMKKATDRFVDLHDGKYFDRLMYTRRIVLSIDTLLIEANERARRLNKMAYVHVVGLGLGVWKIYTEQDKLFMDAFAQRLEFLSLSNVSDVRFAYIKHKMAGPYKHGDMVKGIKLHMVDGNPHERLKEDDEGKLLVVSYAWDANALPGNEFWMGSLSTSSDPAAACSTQVAELHNWHINGKVCGGNLRVATLNGLVTFQEYQELHKND